MVQVLREAGIEVAGEDDRAILDVEGDIRRWIPIPVERSEDMAMDSGALNVVNRKLSTDPVRLDGMIAEGD